MGLFSIFVLALVLGFNIRLHQMGIGIGIMHLERGVGRILL
jgi:hypothetical protein